MHEPAAMKALVYDNHSGAREITERTLQFLSRAAAEAQTVTNEALLDELAQLGIKVIRSKPEMPQLFHAVDRFLATCEPNVQGESPVTFRTLVQKVLRDQLEGLHSTLDRVAAHAQALIPNGAVVVTGSRSSTVVAALRQAHREGKLFDVIATESRPLLEGRTLARELSSERIPVRLLVDALAATAVEGADRVLVGADAITGSSVVNKIGTRMLALAAREAGVPVTVLAESSKAWVKRLDPELGLLTARHRDPKEVWDAPPHGVEVVNLYFERTPLALFESVVDEDGVHPASEHWKKVTSRGYSERMRALMGDELA